MIPSAGPLERRGALRARARTTRPATSSRRSELVAGARAALAARSRPRRVFETMLAQPRFDSEGADLAGGPVRELHATGDRDLYNEDGEGWPVWKGRTFDRYRPDIAPPVYWAEPGPAAFRKRRSRAFREFRGDPRPHLCRRLPDRLSGCCGATNRRTMNACLAPPRVFAIHDAPQLVWPRGDERDLMVLLGVLNSLPFDWLLRRRVETHVTFGILNALPMPEGEEQTSRRARGPPLLSWTIGTPTSRIASGSSGGRSRRTERLDSRPRSTRSSPAPTGSRASSSSALRRLRRGRRARVIPRARPRRLRRRRGSCVTKPEFIDNRDERTLADALRELAADPGCAKRRSTSRVATSTSRASSRPQTSSSHGRAFGSCSAPSRRRRCRAPQRTAGRSAWTRAAGSRISSAQLADERDALPFSRQTAEDVLRLAAPPAPRRGRGTPLPQALPARQGVPVPRSGCDRRLGELHLRRPRPQPRARDRPVPAERRRRGRGLVRRALGGGRGLPRAPDRDHHRPRGSRRGRRTTSTCARCSSSTATSLACSEETRTATATRPGQPGGVTLTDFQRHGFRRALRIIERFDGVLVGDGVGLGKSFIGSELLDHYVNARGLRALVIVPAALRDSFWERHLQRARHRRPGRQLPAARGRAPARRRPRRARARQGRLPLRARRRGARLPQPRHRPVPGAVAADGREHARSSA